MALVGLAAKLGRQFCTFAVLATVCSFTPGAMAQGTSPRPKNVQEVQAEVAELRKAQAATAIEVKQLRDKLDETGWKALDFASQLSSAQWAMFGTGLAFLGLLLTVAALGAYQWLTRRMERRLSIAAGRVEHRLRNAIRNEEVRLQAEIANHVERSKKMMEAARYGAQARVYANISHAFWDQHNRTAGTSTPELDEKRRNLETAIYLSRLGMKIAVEGGTIDPESHNLITSLQSNYIYYIAEFWRFANQYPDFKRLLVEDEKREALEIASVVEMKARRSIAAGGGEIAQDQLENACWVFWNLGSETEKRSVLATLRELYSDETNVAMREWIRQKYFQNKEPTWN